MYWLIRELSPNFFFILFLVLLYQYWIERKDYSNNVKNIYIFLFSAAGIILCMAFPIRIGDGFIYDLRYVPFALGGLYGGRYVAAGLAVVTIGVRLLMGGIVGFYFTVTIVGIGLVVIMMLSRRFFSKKPSTRKGQAVAAAGLLAGIVVILTETSSATESFTMFKLEEWIGYIVTNIFAALLTVNVMESIIKNELVRAKMIRNEKLEVVSHLASSISHEIRNPLTASRGFLQLLNEENISPKCKNYVRIAMEEMDRAEDVIRDYLTFAKPALNESETIQIDEELTRVIKVLTPHANMNNVMLATDLSRCKVKGERTKLQQCFMNLIKNAIEAMPQGGRLIIESIVDESNVQILIKDTGIGMTPEQLSRLGEPYFSTKGMKGTGLGMMVVYRIIESYNGTITVSSTVGEGTTFTIKLPLYHEKKMPLKEIS